MRPFIYFGFHFSLLFLTCTSKSVAGLLKEQDFLFQRRETLRFPQPWKRKRSFFLQCSAHRPQTCALQPDPLRPRAPERPGLTQPRAGVGAG